MHRYTFSKIFRTKLHSLLLCYKICFSVLFHSLLVLNKGLVVFQPAKVLRLYSIKCSVDNSINHLGH